MTPTTLYAVERDAGLRLDQFLSRELSQYSRSRLQDWIRSGRVLVEGKTAKASSTLRGGETVIVTPDVPQPLHAEPEDIPLDILYLDDDVIAINKPAGMVVHAGAGRHSGTLVNALLHRFDKLSNVSGEDRPGVVHRIDRETSGVILVARNDAAHRSLAEQFASREIGKTYLAVTQGSVEAESGTIDKSIERDPVRRTRMTTRTGHGRTAITWWTVLERFARHTWLEVRIGTGRTHQIRVHLASIGHPVAGDTLYGAAAGPVDRFFLHAFRISFRQPTSGESVTVEAPLPAELHNWLSQLRDGTLS
ncbi:MAG: RluA family pseudouridine synthase [Bryobacteraceae bacterium]|nr:RluA family pseudouridine synthase [Bryobacteraceae bacterium]